MHVTTDVPTMKKALAVIKPGVARRGRGLPALAGARFEAKEGRLTVVGSDLDLTIETEVSAEVLEEGLVIIPFAELTKLVKGKGPLELKTDDKLVSVRNGSLSTLRTLPAEEFLRLADSPTGDGIPVDLEALATVVPAASGDASRPILTSVLFKGNEIVATDSYRLHRVIVKGADYPQILVPASAIAPIVKNGQPTFLHADQTTTEKRWVDNGEPLYLPSESVCRRAKNPAYKTWQEEYEAVTSVSFTSGATTWFTRLTEGEYPNYSQLIPDSFPYSIRFDRAAMISAIDSVRHLATHSQPVRLEMTRGSSTLTARVISQDIGEASAEVEIWAPWLTDDPTCAEQTIVAFNPDFLLDALTVGVAGAATMSFTDSLKPTMITEVDGPRTLDRLLMPVRVS